MFGITTFFCYLCIAKTDIYNNYILKDIYGLIRANRCTC